MASQSMVAGRWTEGWANEEQQLSGEEGVCCALFMRSSAARCSYRSHKSSRIDAKTRQA